MSATFRGYGAVYGVGGLVPTVAGVAMGTLTQSADVSAEFGHIIKLKDRDGKMAGYIEPEAIKKIQVTIIAGGASLSLALAACALPGACTLLVIASATVAAFNGSYVIDEAVSVKASNSGAVEVTVSATQYTDSTQAAALATVISS
jgi:hypothetical protein